MVEPFALFCDAAWNWVGFGMGGLIRTHIIRSELEASARLLRINLRKRPGIFGDVRAMEDEALKFWSRRRV